MSHLFPCVFGVSTIQHPREQCALYIESNYWMMKWQNGVGGCPSKLRFYTRIYLRQLRKPTINLKIATLQVEILGFRNKNNAADRYTHERGV